MPVYHAGTSLNLLSCSPESKLCFKNKNKPLAVQTAGGGEPQKCEWSITKADTNFQITWKNRSGWCELHLVGNPPKQLFLQIWFNQNWNFCWHVSVLKTFHYHRFPTNSTGWLLWTPSHGDCFRLGIPKLPGYFHRAGSPEKHYKGLLLLQLELLGSGIWCKVPLGHPHHFILVGGWYCGVGGTYFLSGMIGQSAATMYPCPRCLNVHGSIIGFNVHPSLIKPFL